VRIAHVTDFYLPRLGGIELHVHDLATRQQAAGHEVEIITGTPAGSSTADDTLAVRRLRRVRGLPVYLDPVVLRAGQRAVREGGYDVVHVHAGVCLPLAYGICWTAARAGIPVVVTQHSMVDWFSPLLRMLDLVFRWTRWPLLVTAVSEAAATPLQRIVGDRSRVEVLPNGIDPATWQVRPDPRSPDDVLAVAVMRLAPRKRPMHLLRIMRKVRRELPASVRLRLVVVGEGGERRSLERYVRRRHMGGWVSLPGRFDRDQIRELYRRADLFLGPATLESFGIAALEARSAGVPVVARREGGVGGFVSPGEGVLVGSDADMVSAIVRLVREPVTREAMAARCRATEPPFAWPQVVARTDEAYASARSRVGLTTPTRVRVAS
jgi:glycosyltransferase involved in cell wall biosynthesis